MFRYELFGNCVFLTKTSIISYEETNCWPADVESVHVGQFKNNEILYS